MMRPSCALSEGNFGVVTGFIDRSLKFEMSYCGSKLCQQIILIKFWDHCFDEFCILQCRSYWHNFKNTKRQKSTTKGWKYFFEMSGWINIRHSNTTLMNFLRGMQKDWFEKENWILEVGAVRDGGKIHTKTSMAQLKRCEDASKNDQGWLVSDWRWISGIFEVWVTDGRTNPLIEMRGRI